MATLLISSAMARRRGGWFVVLGIVCVLGAGVAVAMVIGNIAMTGEIEASGGWPSVNGTVVSSDIIEERGRHDYYTVRAQYDYEVGGVVRHGNRVAFYGNGNFDHAADAHAWIARYPRGAQVDVYYDPNKPEEAVLIRGGQGIGVGVIVIFAGLGLAFVAGAIA